MKIDRRKIKIRKATIFDIKTIIEYRIIFLKEIQGISDDELELNLTRSLQEYYLKSIENNSFICWIAEYDSKSIGFGGMLIKEQPGNLEIPNGRIGYVLNMYTIKDYRNNGVGSLIFQKLIDEAKQMNLDRIELRTTQDGEPIYRRFGFSEPHDKVLELRINY